MLRFLNIEIKKEINSCENSNCLFYLKWLNFYALKSFKNI